MLDDFLKISAREAVSRMAQEKVAAELKRLPTEELLEIIETGTIKRAHESTQPSNSTGWLDQFKGSPLMQAAMELEHQEVVNEAQRAQRYAADEELFRAKDQLNLQKRLLEIELAKSEAAGLPGPTAPQVPMATPPAPAPEEAAAGGPPAPQEAQAAPIEGQKMAASTEFDDAFRNRMWGTPTEIKGQLIGGLGGAGLGAALGGAVGGARGAALGGLSGGALGTLAGQIGGHFSQSDDEQAAVADQRTRMMGAGLGVINAPADARRRVQGLSGKHRQAAETEYAADVAANRAGLGLGLGGLAGGALGSLAGPTSAVLGALGGGVLGYQAGKHSGKERGEDVVRHIRKESAAAGFLGRLGSVAAKNPMAVGGAVLGGAAGVARNAMSDDPSVGGMVAGGLGGAAAGGVLGGVGGGMATRMGRGQSLMDAAKGTMTSAKRQAQVVAGTGSKAMHQSMKSGPAPYVPGAAPAPKADPSAVAATRQLEMPTPSPAVAAKMQASAAPPSLDSLVQQKSQEMMTRLGRHDAVRDMSAGVVSPAAAAGKLLQRA